MKKENQDHPQGKSQQYNSSKCLTGLKTKNGRATARDTTLVIESAVPMIMIPKLAAMAALELELRAWRFTTVQTVAALLLVESVTHLQEAPTMAENLEGTQVLTGAWPLIKTRMHRAAIVHTTIKAPDEIAALIIANVLTRTRMLIAAKVHTGTEARNVTTVLARAIAIEVLIGTGFLGKTHITEAEAPRSTYLDR
jgi:hypothetical protein